MDLDCAIDTQRFVHVEKPLIDEARTFNGVSHGVWPGKMVKLARIRAISRTPAHLIGS